MCIHIKRGMPARNNDALKHPLPVNLDQREVLSLALPAMTFMPLAATFLFHSTPSQHFSLSFSSLFWLLPAFFPFSFPILWNSIALNLAVLPRTTTFFSDHNSSLALPSSFQFQFTTLHINRTRGAETSS